MQSFKPDVMTSATSATSPKTRTSRFHISEKSSKVSIKNLIFVSHCCTGDFYSENIESIF